MRAEILQNRLKELGWSNYRLAQEVAKIRNEYWGENITDHRNISSSVRDAVLYPNRARGSQIEAIIIAMGGRIDVSWETPVTVIEKRTEGLSDNAISDNANKPDEEKT